MTIPRPCASDDEAAFRARLLMTFHAEANRHVSELLATLAALKNAAAEEHPALLATACRAAHSLTGAARAVEQADLAQGCARIERGLRQMTEGGHGISSGLLLRLSADIDALAIMVQALPGPGERQDG